MVVATSRITNASLAQSGIKEKQHIHPVRPFLHDHPMRQGNLQSTAMSVLKQCVIRCVGGEGGAALGRSLVGHALDALRECATHPGPRAVACVLETTHPYQNKMVSAVPHCTHGILLLRHGTLALGPVI